MKDMFYNYEHRINVKEYSEGPFFGHRRTLEYTNGAHPLHNAKGEELGIKAKMNSKFKLYFDLEGLDPNIDLRAILESSTLHFDVLDFKREKVAEFVPVLDDVEDLITVNLIAAEDPEKENVLRYGVYRMHLYIEQPIPGGTETFTIFSDRDGILSIE